jgi:hypothetical protein
MNSRLEQFIHDHREEFDGEEPDKKVWEKIRQQTEPGKKKQASLVQPYWVRWSAAAAVILLMAGAAWWYTNTRQGNGQPAQPSIASQTQKPATIDTATQHPDIAAQEPSHTPATTNPGKSPVTGPKTSPDNTTNNDMDASVNEEMYHSARLVELKHNELKVIEKDEP